MNKEPHYRQSGIAFALCALIFIFMALECVLLTSWLWLIVGAITVAVLVYAVASSIKKQPNENTSIQHTYGQQSIRKGLLPILLLISKNQNLTEVRRVNTASTISQRDAYKLMLKDYPDVMSIEQMCEILSISTKTGYRILREGKILSLKVGRAYRIPKAHLFTYLCIGCGEAVTA